MNYMTMNINLPMDNAWKEATAMPATGEPGAVVLRLDKYNIGRNGKYALIVDMETSLIYAAVEHDAKIKIDHLHSPAMLFNILGIRYAGVLVGNAHQAGAVIHVIDDAIANQQNVIDIVNAIALKIESLR
jgi:hypothetical protein